jgi:hypothetical protein
VPVLAILIFSMTLPYVRGLYPSEECSLAAAYSSLLPGSLLYFHLADFSPCELSIRSAWPLYRSSIDRKSKRVPVRSQSGASDVYVTRATRFGALVARVFAVLRKGTPAHLHALGAALQRCADVALAVQDSAGGPEMVVLAATTATVVVVDDFEPLVPGYPARTLRRSKSALHVTVTSTSKYI